MNKTKILATIMVASMVLSGCSKDHEKTQGSSSGAIETSDTENINEFYESKNALEPENQIDLFEGIFLEYTDNATHPSNWGEFASFITINSEKSPYKDYVSYSVSDTDKVDTLSATVTVKANYADMKDYIKEKNYNVKGKAEGLVYCAIQEYTVKSSEVRHYLIREEQYTSDVARDFDIMMNAFFDSEGIDYAVLKKVLVLADDDCSFKYISTPHQDFGIAVIYRDNETGKIASQGFGLLLGVDGRLISINRENSPALESHIASFNTGNASYSDMTTGDMAYIYLQEIIDNKAKTTFTGEDSRLRYLKEVTY